MQPLSMAARHSEEACHRIFGDFAQAGGGPYPASFAQMINNGFSLGLRDLGIEQCRTTSLRELFATEAATEKSDAVLAVDFADNEIALASKAKLLAFGIDTR
jgi:hypothetical protein